MSNYTKAVGTKFHEDGTLKHFPGNTMICKANAIEPLFSELVWAQEQFKILPFAHKFGLLPPESFHMTVFELLCDQVREEKYWSTKMPQDMKLTDVDAFFQEALKKAGFPNAITMKYVETSSGYIIGLKLEPADETNRTLLESFREELSEITGIRFPNHDTYRYHITLAYNLIQLEEKEQIIVQRRLEEVHARLSSSIPVFTLGKPSFVMFEDMGEFREEWARD